MAIEGLEPGLPLRLVLAGKCLTDALHGVDPAQSLDVVVPSGCLVGPLQGTGDDRSMPRFERVSAIVAALAYRTHSPRIVTKRGLLAAERREAKQLGQLADHFSVLCMKSC